MKKGNRKVVSFITTLALVFTTFFSVGVTFATESVDVIEPPELLIAPTPISAEPLISAGSTITFSDITGHWGEMAIKEAVADGFVKGYVDGTFKPDVAVTRAEFVTMVNKALRLRDENTVNLLFKDVKTTAWYYKDIQKASYARYASGVSDTSFMPGKNITREEAAAMLSRFLPKSGFQAETQVSAFPDSSSASTWGKSALAVVINKGYMTGHANGKLSPQASLTRAEATKIIGKILDNETIVREDISVATSGDILKDKIYVGNITIENPLSEDSISLDKILDLYLLGRVEIASIAPAVATHHHHRDVAVIEESNTIETLYGTAVLSTIATTDGAYCGHTESQGGFAQLATITISGVPTTLYAISTSAQLQHLAMHLNAHVILTSDISIGATTGAATTATAMGTLRSTASESAIISNLRIDSFTAGNYVPIGKDSIGFTGTFYGNDKDISGLNINTSTVSNAAIFGYTNRATIKDLNIRGGIVTGSGTAQFVGGLVGYSDNSTISGVSNAANITGYIRVGGIAGYLSAGSTLDDSYNTGTVNANNTVGGLVGNSTGIINECYNTGAVTATDFRVGGIVGDNYIGTVKYSYNTGSIYSYHNEAGGLVGKNLNSSSINNSFNTGAIFGETGRVGGIVGYNIGSTLNDVYNSGAAYGGSGTGGIFGYQDTTGSIAKSFNTGLVYGTPDNYGAIGGVSDSTVTDSHWLTGMIQTRGLTYTDPTVSFNGGATLTAIYSSMSAIATSASGSAIGAITDITFSSTVNPTTFSSLQGSYLKSSANVGITVTAISGTVISYSTGSSLKAAMQASGTTVSETSGTYKIDVTGSGIWVMVKAVNASEPLKNRTYTIYIQ
jgi:hypothetical protein